ncbi:DUF4097 family beta strand repeat-containing protein [Halobacillus yeomjeoni]|uniref:DUF4097 family beta strand repeat-containing protein n=1 Tax=Halobacillus yeomjeoni TaxID=311194 RepID=UPI001CD70FE6|nr:DUF4097 family beta strand repeat-containing protein [Halobacillus yeomjeoni]MCA0984642.1 DUF4097 family beta strand repeat-containing protein [Halobacillus yeomjeoni]
MNEERMRVLKMIEEGTISAEEGSRLLDSLDKEKSEPAKSDKKTYGIRNFLEDAVEKIRNADFDLSFGDYVEFTYETETEDVDFKDIDLSIANGGAKIESWGESHLKAVYDIKAYQVENEEEARERFLADNQFEVKGDLLRIASPSKKIKTNIHLYIPEKYYDFIKMKLSNGSLDMRNVKADHMHLKTANGKVQLESVNGESCKIGTVNGAVRVTEGKFDTCETDTVNGSITLRGEYGKSDASAISGSIVVEHTGGRAHTGFYKTGTGSVDITLPKHKQIDGVLRSSIGKIDCQLDNYKILSDKNEVVNKKLEFEAFEEFGESFHVEAETKTGTVTVKRAL